MTATLAPFGLRPVFHPSGTIRNSVGTWASGYAANVYTGDPVTIATDGSVVIATSGTGNPVVGAFIGVEYADASGRPVTANFWTSGQIASAAQEIRVYYTSDPAITYEIQGDGPITQLRIGEQAAITSIGAGSNFTGQSAARLQTSTLSNSTVNQLVVTGLSRYVDNAWGDAFTIVQVQIRTHPFLAGFAAF